MSTSAKRIGSLIGTGALVAGLSVTVLPAQACGCGALIPPEGGSISVDTEQAAISWDGETERMVLSVNVEGDADAAALVVPTPSKAEVAPASPGLFEELADFTGPAAEHVTQWWPEFLHPIDVRVGTQHPVEVLDEIDLGALDATVLAAKDADELANWLSDHNFVMQDDLAAALTPYIQDEWFYVVIKLDSEQGGLAGALPSVSLTFPSNQLIYPMRLSATASGPLLVRTYTFAEHRMERDDAGARSEVLWAGDVGPIDFINQTAVELSEAGEFLTLDQDYIARPEEIAADFTFAAASEDVEYRSVTTVVDKKQIFGAPAGPTLVFGGLILIGVAGSTWSYLGRRRRARADA